MKISNQNRNGKSSRSNDRGQGAQRFRGLLIVRRRTTAVRTAAAAIDYVLVLAVILPLATLLFLIVPRMIQLVYEMTITMIGSPLM